MTRRKGDRNVEHPRCVLRMDGCESRAAARLMKPGEPVAPVCMPCLWQATDGITLPPTWGVVPLEFGGPHTLDTPVMRVPLLRTYLRANLDAILDVDPILAGHTANLLMQHPAVGRVWHSRMTRADGARYNNAIEVERLVADTWWVSVLVMSSTSRQEASPL